MKKMDLLLMKCLEETNAIQLGLYEEMVTFQLGAISTMLADISKSLAILADRAESEEEYGR